MQAQTAVVIGSTGLIGQQLVQQLLQDDTFSKIVLLVRRPVTLSHAKLDVRIVDFHNREDLAAKLGEGQVIFCCIGTTQKQVKGDKTAYRKIDYEIPVNTARLAVQRGFRQFALVSAVGASSASGNFYLQLKGAVEEDVAACAFTAVHIFRPSLLMGNRKEFRLTERIAQVIVPVIGLLFMGSLRRYKPIHDVTVARAMVAAVKKEIPGVHVYEYDEMER